MPSPRCRVCASATWACCRRAPRAPAALAGPHRAPHGCLSHGLQWCRTRRRVLGAIFTSHDSQAGGLSCVRRRNLKRCTKAWRRQASSLTAGAAPAGPHPRRGGGDGAVGVCDAGIRGRRAERRRDRGAAAAPEHRGCAACPSPAHRRPDCLQPAERVSLLVRRSRACRSPRSARPPAAHAAAACRA